MQTIFKDMHRRFIEVIEIVLSAMIVVGLLVYAWSTVVALSAMDWQSTATFEEFVQRILFAMIGIELLQIIRIHALRDVFLVALLLLVRKALMPSTSINEIIALVATSICIIALWQILPNLGAQTQEKQS